MASIKLPIKTYGCPAIGETQMIYDMWAFANRVSVDEGAPPRVELFKRIADELLPEHFEWHKWTDDIITPLCNGDWTAFSGCSNSAKTYNVTGFACLWWLCNPGESSVTFVSTTVKSLRRRTWAEVQKIHSKVSQGNFVDSRVLWQWTKGDDKHAIIGKACEEGATYKVADDIKGVHTKRQMVVIEEATAVPEAIYDACSNLYSYPEEFILVLNGNPRSKLDQMGRFIEPKDGWISVSVDTEEWETKNQINGKPAMVVRFDAEKSPNIIEGKVVSSHLPTPEKVKAAKMGGETPLYWSNFRGFPPPDGLTKNIFSETAIVANDGMGIHKFSGRDFDIIGAFDHARDGGDDPTLRFAKLGEIEGGKMGIQLFPPVVISINPASPNPIDFQIAEQLRRQCEDFQVNGIRYSCQPNNLAIDAGGDGAGLCDIVNRLWSFDIHRVQFGGSPSEDSTSLEDHRPAKEVYRNKRAEMYFRSRDALNHGQLKGIDAPTGKELCSILFDDSKRLIVVESKKDFRKRNNDKSPDKSDTVVMILEMARKKGFRLAAQGETVKVSSNFDEFARKAGAVYISYAADEIEV